MRQGMQRVRLPEFLEIFVPTKDRVGRALSPAKLREWKTRLADYLLDDLNVTGFHESKREGVWRSKRREAREYDPRTDRLSVVRERVHVLRTSCTKSQREAFERRGEALLLDMGQALNQEAVAYETRYGLVILFMS